MSEEDDELIIHNALAFAAIKHREQKEPFIRILLGGIQEQMISDFQKLLDSKTYEIISVEEDSNEKV